MEDKKYLKAPASRKKLRIFSYLLTLYSVLESTAQLAHLSVEKSFLACWLRQQMLCWPVHADMLDPRWLAVIMGCKLIVGE